MLPLILGIHIRDALLPAHSQLADKGSRLNALPLGTLDHEELDKERVTLHVQILVHHVGEGKLAAHEPTFPAEVPRHEANLVFPGGHCSLFCEVCPLQLVHADGLPLNLWEVLEVSQMDCYITVDLQVW